MKPLEMPKCKQQRDEVEKQIELFEFAQDLAFNEPDKRRYRK